MTFWKPINETRRRIEINASEFVSAEGVFRLEFSEALKSISEIDGYNLTYINQNTSLLLDIQFIPDVESYEQNIYAGEAP